MISVVAYIFIHIEVRSEIHIGFRDNQARTDDFHQLSLPLFQSYWFVMNMLEGAIEK
jgi:hypothetical protein